MSFRTVFILVIAGFCLFCGLLVAESGVLCALRSPAGTDVSPSGSLSGGKGCILLQQTTDVPTPAGANEPNVPAAKPAPEQKAPQLQPAGEEFSAIGGTAADVNIPLGSVDPASGFEYQLMLDSKGAAIRTATFSRFDDRRTEPTRPLTFLSPVNVDGRTIRSLATTDFTLLDQGRRLRLSQLDWKLLATQKLDDGGESASFEATIVDSHDQPVLKLTKTYRVHPGTYLLDVAFNVENLSDQGQRIQYTLEGPVGLERESSRSEMRKVVAGFRNPEGQVVSTRLDLRALSKATTLQERSLNPRNAKSAFLWAAAENKYFAAIMVPSPAPGQEHADWIGGKWGLYFQYGQSRKGTGENATIGLAMATVPASLAPAGEADSSRTYDFQLYIGPKDKSRFDKNPLYKQLGFVQTIDFQGCCCPASIINPLAFGILAIMNWMHGFWPYNYGIVIIILVLVMRLILHPIQKYSQVSMHKMSKLAPRAEEIKKKYANNKAEMNKKLMELYREQGASPIMGMLPMFLQMPIWIALWSAIYTSIDLRGAAFLPFWITDLSAPDAVVSWPAVTIPLVGWSLHSLNLLPILMGVAFYLQQKLMPTQSAAPTNPQMAQQQKMMMIMLPLIMPLALYNAPSGVNLYIMASTFGGVIEQYVIRKHIQAKEEQEARGTVPVTSKTGGKVKKKKPKPFFRF
ncbi:MAG: YidC/Oxa1 family insertase periplasmic-domain containing protein [Sedimentisphaerales bacterium]|nr:YidC/Oxa1 family insertase periplasmic-domain containing protein [Sedimentisphaerales bacterium]